MGLTGNIIVSMLITMLVLYAQGIMHEQVHVAVWRGLGYDAEVTYGPLYMKTVPENITQDAFDKAYLPNMINEAVGYNLQIPGLMVVFMTSVVAFEVIDWHKEAKKNVHS